MNCPSCNHVNQGGTFCENCGTKLTTAAVSQVAASYEQNSTIRSGASVPPASNQYLEATKVISKQYFGYFMQVLKKPYQNSQAVGAEHFVNGLITIILFSLIIPLTIYFSAKGMFGGYGGGLFGEASIPFGDFVIKPFFAYLIFMLLIAVFSFIAIKLGKVQISFKEVVARFGSFLIPFVAILVIGLIFSILKISFALVILLIALMSAIFIVPTLVIAGFKRNSSTGLDTIYGILLTYILSFITMAIMGEMLFDAIRSTLFDFLPF
jgi:small-conductance mechanosensitive channel